MKNNNMSHEELAYIKQFHERKSYALCVLTDYKISTNSQHHLTNDATMFYYSLTQIFTCFRVTQLLFSNEHVPPE